MRGAFARAVATLRCGGAVFAVVLAAQAAVAATAPPDVPLKDNLYGAKFVDSQHGWVVGAFGSIARSADGGKTWQPQVSKTTQQLYDVDFVDARQGWIVGRQGLILHTTDGGATWAPQTSGTDQHLFSVDFVDDQYGVAVGDFGTILVTSDGGGHWTTHSLSQDVILYDVAMADRMHGWAAGEVGTVMVTTDGGQTWTKQETGIEKTLFGVHFADAQRGWVVGIDALILHTPDGGQTWQVQNGSTEMRALEQVGFGQAYENPSLYAVSVIGSTGIAVGEIGAIYLSSDGGQTWKRRVSPGEQQASGPKWFRAVSMAPGADGAIVGADGARLLIVDGQVEQRDGGTRAAEAVH